MNFKLATVGFSVALAALAGCAADSSDSASSTQDLGVIHDPPVFNVKVVGAWKAKPDTATAGQFFQGIVFKSDQTFFADANTGIRCITTPCPTTVRLTGVYGVIGNKLLLTTDAAPENQDAFASDFYSNTYQVTRIGDALSIESVSERKFANDLGLESSYCAEPVDCASQGLIHPMCAPGGWTCSAENTCGFSCGFATESR